MMIAQLYVIWFAAGFLAWHALEHLDRARFKRATSPTDYDEYIAWIGGPWALDAYVAHGVDVMLWPLTIWIYCDLWRQGSTMAHRRLPLM